MMHNLKYKYNKYLAYHKCKIYPDSCPRYTLSKIWKIPFLYKQWLVAKYVSDVISFIRSKDVQVHKMQIQDQ